MSDVRLPLQHLKQIILKKITSLFTLFIVFSFALNAQNISFEASEGYTLGDITGQGNWTTVKDAEDYFSKYQVVSDEMPFTGDYSLKLSKDADFPTNTLPFIGAFYTYSTPISTDAAAFSMDVYMTNQSDTSMITRIGLYDTDNGDYRSFMEFHNEGDISVLANGGNGFVYRQSTGETWATNTWFNVKIETIGEVSKFYIDGEFIFESELGGSGTINQLKFEHDNYEGIMYIDNVITEGEVASVDDLKSELSITHFYNTESKSLILKTKNEAFDKIIVYNSMGQQVIDEKLSKKSEIIEMTDLKNGVYTAQLKIGNEIKTLKFVKY